MSESSADSCSFRVSFLLLEVNIAEEEVADEAVILVTAVRTSSASSSSIFADRADSREETATTRPLRWNCESQDEAASRRTTRRKLSENHSEARLTCPRGVFRETKRSRMVEGPRSGASSRSYTDSPLRRQIEARRFRYFFFLGCMTLHLRDFAALSRDGELKMNGVSQERFRGTPELFWSTSSHFEIFMQHIQRRSYNKQRR